jgi:hypothetical protein
MIRNTYISGFTSSGGGGGFVFQNLQSVLTYGNTASNEMIFDDGTNTLDFVNADAGQKSFGLRFLGADQVQISRIYFRDFGDGSPLISMFDGDIQLEFQLDTVGLTFFNYNNDPTNQLSLKADSTNDYTDQNLILPEDSGKLQTQKTPLSATISVENGGFYEIGLASTDYGYNYSWDLDPTTAFDTFGDFTIAINEKSAGFKPYCRYYLALGFQLGVGNTIYIQNSNGDTAGIYGTTTITEAGLYTFMIDDDGNIYISKLA